MMDKELLQKINELISEHVEKNKSLFIENPSREFFATIKPEKFKYFVDAGLVHYDNPDVDIMFWETLAKQLDILDEIMNHEKFDAILERINMIYRKHKRGF